MSEITSLRFEVLAGQHRIAALREYVSDTESDPAELWWTCELYDQGLAAIGQRPPPHHQETRSLATVTPSKWLQMALNYSRLNAFRIGGEPKFPARRLAIFWNNLPWRRVITQWCRTRLGMDTFAISLTEWMAGLRIDEYYVPDTTIHIGSSDWDQLAVEFATRGDLTPDALAKFYNVFGRKRRRRHGLLTSLSDSEYDAFYRHMTTADQHDFSSPHQIPRSHLEAMVQVLHHIIAWIDLEMMVTLLQQSHLRDALRNLARSNGMSNFKASNKQAIDMQKTILDFAREHVAEFLSCPARLTFFKGASALNLTTSDYTTRFVYGVWTHLLRFTREYIATIIKSPTLIFYEEWDRVAVTSPMPVELSDSLSSVIANARDAAAKAKITRAGQEALEIIQKPGNSQGGRASGTAESHSSINSTDLPRAPAAMSRPKIENGR
ncbi:hypothetical protein E4U35_006088 [Claviceps purpurea]|nr:hypothetical protein E4U35_006088 [Claviceps purpurea]